MKKASRLKFGIYLLVLAGVVGYYQIRLGKFNGVQYVTCYQVKQGVNIIKGETLDQNMFEKSLIDKNKVPSDYIKALDNIDEEVANDNLYGKDFLTKTKIKSKSDWDKDTDRYVCITSSDNFNGSDVKPTDKIDIFIYNPLTQSYDLVASDIEILDIKDKDGISYMDSKDKTFLPVHIYFKYTNSGYKNIIDKLAIPSSKIAITIHGNRLNVQQNSDSVNNSGILNLK